MTDLHPSDPNPSGGIYALLFLPAAASILLIASQSNPLSRINDAAEAGAAV